MSDTQNLDEVVVTAMGISKEKKALGYAVQDVKSDELTQGANTSLSGALQGKVSGSRYRFLHRVCQAHLPRS